MYRRPASLSLSARGKAKPLSIFILITLISRANTSVIRVAGVEILPCHLVCGRQQRLQGGFVFLEGALQLKSKGWEGRWSRSKQPSRDWIQAPNLRWEVWAVDLQE